MTEIILKDIFKSYDQTEVIHGVDLKVESGKFLVLVGPSGCGKSCLLYTSPSPRDGLLSRMPSSA